MNTLQSPKATYVTVFLVGAVIALLLAQPSRGAEPFRLDRIAVVRFTPTPDGRVQLQHGILDIFHDIAWRGTQNIPHSPSVPEWALNRVLVNVQAWIAFQNLGDNATANFEVHAGGIHISIGDQAYMAVGVAPTAHNATGRVINLSARTRIDSQGDVVIAGFVIEDRPRMVLVRAVGPSLRRFNVPSAHPDPWLTIKRGSQSIAENDDWSNQAGAELVAKAATRVGAFPLDPSAYDAATLVMLPPGAYTVHVGTSLLNIRDRDVLVEVYSVPEDLVH